MMVILDRDGVINHESIEYVKSPQEWTAISGSLEAIAKLNKAGYKVVIATNQSGVGRGYYSDATLLAIHQKLHDQLSQHGGHIDAIYYCPHTPDAHCSCRKPEPGMLLEIAKDFSCDLARSIFVGDSWRDLQAAKAVGCRGVLVRTGHGEQTLAAMGEMQGISVYQDLSTFVDDFLGATAS